MKLTNALDLPQPFEAAVRNDGYSSGGSNITASQFGKPVQAIVLEDRHGDDISVDVADRIFALLGQLMHGILERAETQAITEDRLYMRRHGWIVSGQFDRLLLTKDGSGSVLQDYKLTSLYAVKGDAKSEWVAQLNIYRLLLKENGYPVPDRLEIVAVLRDWSKIKSLREEGYPIHQVTKVDVEVWPIERTEKLIRERIATLMLAHFVDDSELPECSDEDRWDRAGAWKIFKGDNKRATKVHDTEEAANEHLAEFRKGKDGGKYRIEFVAGESVRCQYYCDAAPFCHQWSRINPDRFGIYA